MVRLEEIIPGSRIRGIVGAEYVEVLAARSFGPDAVEVTYKGNGAVDQTVLSCRRGADFSWLGNIFTSSV